MPSRLQKKKPSTGNPPPPPPPPTIGFLPPGARPVSGAPPPHAGDSRNGKPAKQRSRKGKVSAEDSLGFTQHNAEDAFGYGFEKNFVVPKRLASVPHALVMAVNDFHYAMMNDVARNNFYYDLLKSYVTAETGVLEVGAGSGLLSMMAAKLGAKWVVAVEGSPEMAQLARRNIKANNLEDRIKVLNMLSTELTLKDLPERPHVLVSEIFGTMLLGESALDYIVDVRERLLRPDTKIIPQRGVQYAVPMECPALDQVCSVGAWNGFDLSHVMAIKDTTSVVFTKQCGFRLSSMPYKFLAEPVPILDIDFATTSRKDLKRQLHLSIPATETATAHAWLFFFVVKDSLKPTEGGGEEVLYMSTNPKDTVDNFPRDMQWGQALQLIDTNRDPAMPCALHMEKGETYNFRCHFSEDCVVVQLNYLASESERAAAMMKPLGGGEAATATANESAKREEEAVET